MESFMKFFRKKERKSRKQSCNVGQTSVMVLLHYITQLLAQGNNRHLLVPVLTWHYHQFEVMLGFLTFYNEETHNGGLLDDEIMRLAYETEDYVEELYRRCSTEQRQIIPQQVDAKAKLTNDILGITNLIRRSMPGSCRFEYDTTREKAIQMLKQSLPRTTRGWVADPEADLAEDRTKHCGRLVDRLINGESPKRGIIVIIGNDEPGMTHLVKKVYNDASVVGYFESRAWVLVSETYILRNLLLSILNDITDISEEGMYDEMEEWELKRQVWKLLCDRRYLIVFQNDPSTDLWNFHFKDALPVNKKGSRILFTTDNFARTYFLSTFDLENCSCSPYSESQKCNGFYLASLTRERQWEHFSKTVFGENECPKELKRIGRRILDRCPSGPFIRVTVACLLRASEKTVFRWSNLVNQFREWEASYPPLEEYTFVCYNEMPQHLKPCLVYLGLFPEGAEISVKQLMRLWIAEELVQWVENTNSTNKQARSMEDVAEEDYLEGLIGLNFIQVTKRRSDGGPKSFRINHYLRNICINILRREDFMWVLGGERYFGSASRRLSILNNLPDGRIFPNLRSLYSFSKHASQAIQDQWKAFSRPFPLLRILYLGEVGVAKLPEDVMGELFHLRYLSMKPAKNIRAPKSTFNLWNLQTIDLRTTQFSELPKGIWKMHQLRHLFLNGDGQSRLPNPECEDCTLPNLQTLSYISINPDDDINISERAPNLKKLGLYSFRCFPLSEQHVTFNFPPQLRSLKFVSECAFEEQIKFPDTITKITLKKVHLEQNVIDTFGKLPNLQILKLVQTSFDEGELIFGEDSFPQLQLLKFEASNIVTWRLTEGAMPNLHRLVINKCSQLTEPPSELQKVKTLEELELSWASSRLAKKLDDDLKGKKGLKIVIHGKNNA